MKHHQDTVEEKMKTLSGDLIVKYFPTKSVGVMGLKAHLEKTIMLGNKPALVIVDYGDLLKINAKKDKHEALEELYEELRGMAGEYDIPVWTASQAGRSALEEDVIEADKIASSYGKVMVADFLMSLSRKVEDKMSGTGRGHVIKNRFGPDGITLPSKGKEPVQMNTTVRSVQLSLAIMLVLGVTTVNAQNNHFLAYNTVGFEKIGNKLLERSYYSEADNTYTVDTITYDMLSGIDLWDG